MKASFSINALPSPTGRYHLERKLGAGIFGEVHRATDSQASGKSVAVKIRIYNDETEGGIQDEYKILRDFTNHPNIIDFYGIFCDRADGSKKIWFVLELCDGGSVIDIVQKLIAKDNKMSEEHIAFILKETIKALIYLHENKVMHRNIRCSNILLTKDGEVKLSDFGLSCQLSGTLGKRHTCIGSPSWMAPEIITGVENGYGNRSDVWALGITAIEMADGKAPFQDMHPTRALFQIVRNPPPSLGKPSTWSNEINDFITECLEKNPDHRPFVMELQEHPFIQNVPENDYYLSQELKKLIMDLNSHELKITKPPERVIQNGFLRTENNTEPESLQVEDLAALDVLTEDKVMEELQTKLAKGHFMTFIGEILLILNPNLESDIYNEHFHQKYEFKSRSDNAPHIYAVADSAYQDAIHHNEPQHIVFSGESKSGKTTNMVHALEHLTYLGAMKNNTAERIQKASKVIRAAISSSSPINMHSTRSIFQTQVTYGSSGKLSGAIFWVYQLEKWRVSSTDMTHANFNLLYYFYDAMEAKDKLETYYLEKNRKHRYLRMLDEPSKSFKDIRNTPEENVKCYKELISCLEALEWEPEDINTLETVLGAILLLGNVRFKESKDGLAEIENSDEAIKVAKLLSLEQPKFLWALLNYCVVERGTAIKRKHSSDEARDARDTLANSLYKRIVDWMINLINFKLSFGRSVFGDKYVVNLLDMFGFECYHRNRLEQLIVNTTNEQIQFLYNQRIFAWEIQEQNEEDIPPVSMQYYDNKYAVDQLMGRPLGLFYILDEASSTGRGQEFIMTTIRNSSKGPFVKLSGSHEFSVAHYTGKINYDCREMAEKNKDFLPPEIIETMRSSCDIAIQQMFRNKLTKTGNLTLSSNLAKIAASPNQTKKKLQKTKAEKESDNKKARKFNTLSRGQYSQVHRMRTAAATYRATSLELLKQLSIGPASGGIHFVRCIRPDLNDNPKGFQPDVVRQQLRALAVLDTAKARQRGFSSRIPFAEFIRRYKFLAFDFDENVEVTKENCRLLLIRLKMEGWVIGKTKVFLKYYNEEFLARLYEVQVKKIIKVQSMMRAFLARRKAVKSKSKSEHLKDMKKQYSLNLDEGEAALLIQKAYRGYVVRKAYGPLLKSTGQIDEDTAEFLKKFAVKWKSRSIFQVLLQYRAVRFQDLVHFSQQVHIYNQAVMEVLISTSVSVLLDRVDPQAKGGQFLGQALPAVRKLPFRVDQLQYYDTSHMCHPGAKSGDTFASTYDSDHEQWDEPLKRRSTSGTEPNEIKPKSTQAIINVPFCRDPTQPLPKLTPIPDSPKEAKTFKPTQNWDSRPQVYKKKAPGKPNYQPPTPWSSNKDISSPPIQFTPPVLRKTEISTSLYGINAPNIMDNPIKEMQALAKSANDLDNDDAPFNFQAMLKKTPKNRASMKRSGEELTMYNGKPPTGKAHNKGPAPSKPKELKRIDSRELIKTVLKKSDSDYELEGRDNKMENERVELAPGIIVEGTVTDL